MLFLALNNPDYCTLELYQKHRIKEVRLYKENPFQHDRLITRIIHFIKAWWQGGSLTLKLTVESKEYFVKTQDLSQEMDLKVRDLHRIIKGRDLTTCLADHNLEQILKRYQINRRELKELANRVGYRNIRDALELRKGFDALYLPFLLTQIGKQLERGSEGKKVYYLNENYEFSIEKTAIKVTRIVREKEKVFTYSFDLHKPTQVNKEEMQSFLDHSSAIEQLKPYLDKHKDLATVLHTLDKWRTLTKDQRHLANEILNEELLNQIFIYLNELNPEQQQLFLKNLTTCIELSLQTPGSMATLMEEVNLLMLVKCLVDSPLKNSEKYLEKFMRTFASLGQYLALQKQVGKVIKPICQGNIKHPATFAFSIDQNKQLYILFGKITDFSKGAYKVVSRAVCLNTGQSFVRLKILKNDRKKTIGIKRLKNEMTQFSEIYTHAAKNGKHIYLSEYFKQIYKLDRRAPILLQPHYKEFDFSIWHKFSPIQKLQILEDIIQGVVAVHEAGFIHSDLKLENILCRKEDNQQWRAVLTDFGEAVKIGKKLHSFSPMYASPEMVIVNTSRRPKYVVNLENGASTKMDSFALGVILLACLCPGAKPFSLIKTVIESKEIPLLSCAPNQEVLNDIIDEINRKAKESQEIMELPEQVQKIHHEIFNMCKQLLKLNSEERLSCQDALTQFTQLKAFC